MVTSLVGYVITDCDSYIICWLFYFKPGVRNLFHESHLQALPPKELIQYQLSLTVTLPEESLS